MKIAICISGQLRSYRSTFPSFERFFSAYSPDVFLATATTTAEEQEQEQVVSLFHPIRYTFDNDDILAARIQARKLETSRSQVIYLPGEFERERLAASLADQVPSRRLLLTEEPPLIQRTFGDRAAREKLYSEFVQLPLSLNGGISEAALFQFYRCEEASRLCESYSQETNTVYDLIIRTRFDVDYRHREPERPFTPETLEKDEIFALSAHASRITYLMNDFFFYGTPFAMFQFQKMFSGIGPTLEYMAQTRLVVPAHGYQESLYWAQTARLNLRIREAGSSPNLVITHIVRPS